MNKFVTFSLRGCDKVIIPRGRGTQHMVRGPLAVPHRRRQSTGAFIPPDTLYMLFYVQFAVYVDERLLTSILHCVDGISSRHSIPVIIYIKHYSAKQSQKARLIIFQMKTLSRIKAARTYNF